MKYLLNRRLFWFIIPALCVLAWIFIILRSPSTWGAITFSVNIGGITVLVGSALLKKLRDNLWLMAFLNVVGIIGILFTFRNFDGVGSCNICEAWSGSDAFQAIRTHKDESKIEEGCYRRYEKASTNTSDNIDEDPFFDFCEPTEEAKKDATWGAVDLPSDPALIEPKSGDFRPINAEWYIRFQSPIFKESGVARYRIFLTTKELEDIDGKMQYFQIMCSPQKSQSMADCKVPKLEETEWYQYAVPGTTPREIYWRVRAELQNGDARWILDKAEDGKELYFLPRKSQ